METRVSRNPSFVDKSLKTLGLPTSDWFCRVGEDRDSCLFSSQVSGGVF